MTKKGFTVKAKLPEKEPNENEFDLQAAKEMVRGNEVGGDGG